MLGCDTIGAPDHGRRAGRRNVCATRKIVFQHDMAEGDSIVLVLASLALGLFIVGVVSNCVQWHNEQHGNNE